jgi:hypothetical protein
MVEAVGAMQGIESRDLSLVKPLPDGYRMVPSSRRDHRLSTDWVVDLCTSSLHPSNKSFVRI